MVIDHVLGLLNLGTLNFWHPGILLKVLRLVLNQRDTRSHEMLRPLASLLQPTLGLKNSVLVSLLARVFFANQLSFQCKVFQVISGDFFDPLGGGHLTFKGVT